MKQLPIIYFSHCITTILVQIGIISTVNQSESRKARTGCKSLKKLSIGYHFINNELQIHIESHQGPVLIRRTNSFY